jgi:hypothetical protein
MNQDVLAAVSPSIILVEECGEILEPQLMAVLSPSVEHLILVGDHKQLRPSVNSYELVKKLVLNSFVNYTSAFLFVFTYSYRCMCSSFPAIISEFQCSKDLQ